jgi:hypothetical protein
VVDGLTEADDLINTPVAIEITEDFFSVETRSEPTDNALRSKISE